MQNMRKREIVLFFNILILIFVKLLTRIKKLIKFKIIYYF